MKKLPILLLVLLPLACQKTETETTTATETGSSSKLAVKEDTPQRLAQLPKTVVDYDRALLNDNEKQVVAKLIEASSHIDEIFWRQVSEDNPKLRMRLEQQATESDLDRAGYE